MTIRGTPGNDVLTGTPGSDVIAAFGGADRIRGGGGADLICGGAGDDVIRGGAGNDRLAGGAGQDALRGEKGNDRLFGGPGADRLRGGAGTDRCEAGGKGDEPPRCENPGFLRAGNVQASTDESTATTILVLPTAANPDGRKLTIGWLQASGVTGTVGLTTNRKAVQFSPAGQFDSLAPGQTATTKFRYRLTDHHGHGSGATVKVTVNGTDTPPTAVADTAQAVKGAPRRIDVLANDSDPDGGSKKIVSVGQPEHGTATVIDGGLALEYQPDPGYCNDGGAPDRLTYTLDGGSSATVSVAVACATKLFVTEDLFPSFDPSVSDYVVRCDGSPLQVSGYVVGGESVAVDGQPPQTGVISPVAVPLQENQEFDFTIAGAESHDYHVRCLPPDFPPWEYQRLLPPRHALYVAAPTLTLGAPVPRYGAIFDDHGVPIWWDTQAAGPLWAKILPDGNIVWWRGDEGASKAGFEIRELDGTLVETVRPASGEPSDAHEFQLMPNGDYVIITFHPEEHVDLTAYGGGSDETVMANDIEELEPGGGLVWEWHAFDHIGLDETERWWPSILGAATVDAEHMNAVEPVGEDAFLVSLRHTDAVYKIDKATGEVMWKLGGTETPESLTVLGDPQGEYPLGGQHDVRLQPDGTITIHDNNTGLPNPLRAVRYEIDEGEKTATFVEQRTDPEAPSSICCGSARRSTDGSWLMSWGANSLVTEFDAAGQRTFRLGFGGGIFSYRAIPVAEGLTSPAALRAGMDSMHPRP